MYFVSIVDQTIEDRVSQGGVTEIVMPASDGELAGDDCGFSIESVIEYFQQVALSDVIDGSQSPIVEEEDVDAGELFQPGGIAAVTFGNE